MKIRSTINGLAPRTLRDATRDPWDWCEASPRPDTPTEQALGFALSIVIGIVLAAAVLHWAAA